jgi:CBS domain-containing protein
MQSTLVKEVMTANPYTIEPHQSVMDAAQIMRDLECGVLPVGSKNHIVGMLTDRDITIRLTADGKDAAKTEVKQIMSKKDINTCSEDDSIEDAAETMLKHNVSRLIALKDDKVTGIVTLATLLRAKGDESEGENVLHALLNSQCALDIDKRKGAAKKALLDANTTDFN